MKTFLIALVPVLLAVPSIAQAEPISTRQVAVSTSGLDLTSASGAATLLRQVRDAAERGCRDNANWDRWSKDFRQCRADAVAAVVAKLDAPVVSALYRGEAAPTLIAAAK